MQLRKTRSKPSSGSSTNGTPFIPLTEGELHELIAARAYELYLQRATAPGDELADWLKAETDVHATIDSLSAPAPKAEKPAALPGRITRARSKSTTPKTPVQKSPA